MHRRRASGQQTNSGQLDALAEIGALIARGRKIEAIKTYRETFGVGLKEAKEAVEALERGESVQM
jgi:ribosomal protein L7/L12